MVILHSFGSEVIIKQILKQSCRDWFIWAHSVTQNQERLKILDLSCLREHVHIDKIERSGLEIAGAKCKFEPVKLLIAPRSITKLSIKT